jgi:hypothetical protein
MTLSGGVWIVMAVFVVGFLGLILYFSPKGTEIGFHPWGDSRGDAPASLGSGNIGKDPAVDVGNWTRGTSPGRRTRGPASSVASRGDYPDVEAQLVYWRTRSRSTRDDLCPPADPARDHILGAPSAPLELVEYGDFECPSCQAAFPVVRRLRKQLGDELLIVFRHFPIVDAHPMAVLAAEAAEAAGAQGRFWELHRRIYMGRRPPTVESLNRDAKRLGLNIERFQREIRERRYTERVREDLDSGIHCGVNASPTLFVNGVRHDDLHTVDALLATLEEAREWPRRRAAS